MTDLAVLKTLGADEVARLAMGESYTPFSKRIVTAAARNGELRGKKVGKEWRFLEDEVRNWLRNRS